MLSDRDILRSSPFDFQIHLIAFHYILHNDDGDPDCSSSQVCDGDDPVYSGPQASEDTSTDVSIHLDEDAPTDSNIKLNENVSRGINMLLFNTFNTLRHHLLHQLLTHK